MPAPDPDPNPARRLRFDGTVNAGHILTVLTFLLAGASAWFHLDGRVTRLEDNKVVMTERFDREGSEIKRALRDLHAKLDRLIERLTVRP